MLNLEPTPVGCRRWITSNLAEGSNGCIVKFRTLDPYNCVHQLMTYAASRLHYQRETVEKLVKTGRKISDKARDLYLEQMKLARINTAYSVTRINDSTHFLVKDSQSDTRRSHQVCIDPKNPSCTQCDTWVQYAIPCRHILLALMKDDKSQYLLSPGSRELFYESFFHPGYLVANLQLAYKDCKINLPHAPVGEPIDLIEVDDDEEDTLEEKSDNTSMKPPPEFSLENYENKKRPGRRRIKRVRNNGAKASDGGQRIRKRSKMRQGRSAVGNENLGLLDISEWTF